MNTKYEPVIGLEIHIELATKSKMFCSCSADYFGAKPNTHTCPVCLGLPGAMPKANKKAIKFTQKFGAAIGCRTLLSSKFDRKNYFYPDLAKGFQISQYDSPFTVEGLVTIKTEAEELKRIGITRTHLEEDTGKLTHATVNNKRVTFIDFNRSSVPLMEIVSEPNMESAQEAKLYAQKIRQIARYLGISDADMEKGSMRIEPNVSLRKGTEGSKGLKVSKELPPYKVELKNINSFKFVERAIDYEIKRQEEILDYGKVPVQETRGFNEQKGITVSQRSKEFAHDYRYFPEPDLPPLVFTNGEKAKISAKSIANFIINQKPNIEAVLPADLVSQIYQKAKTAYISDDDLEKIVKKVIDENKKAVQDYKNGKYVALQVLVGAVMKESKRNTAPQKAKATLENLLN